MFPPLRVEWHRLVCLLAVPGVRESQQTPQDILPRAVVPRDIVLTSKESKSGEPSSGLGCFSLSTVAWCSASLSAYLLCSLLLFSSSLFSLLLISSSFFLSSLVHLPSCLFLLLCGPPLDAHSLVEHLHLLAGVGYHHNLCLLFLGLLHFAHLPPHLPQGHTGHQIEEMH